MPVPTYAWNTIAATQTDADSPINEILMEGIRQNLIHLEEWLGDGYTSAKNHDHDDVNSKSVILADGAVVTAKLATANVTLAKLKMARGSYGAASSGPHYIVIALNSHIPSAQKSSGTYSMQLALQSRFTEAWCVTETAEITVITSNPSTDQFYVYWDYHTN